MMVAVSIWRRRRLEGLGRYGSSLRTYIKLPSLGKKRDDIRIGPTEAASASAGKRDKIK